MPGGRPSKIETIDLSKVTHYASKGYTDVELANIFNVTEQTINNWKPKYPQFFESLKSGKLLADAKVEASLFQRACGYSHPEVHITNYLGKVTLTPIIKHYPPDPVSMIFWLKNRNPDEWRDRTDINHNIKSYKHEENANTDTKSLRAESIRLAEKIIKNRRRVSLPEES